MNVQVVGWALGRALLLAVATAVVALLLATTLSGDGAERLATVAYVALIFAAVILLVQRFIPPSVGDEPTAIPGQLFPKFLAFSVGVAIFVSVAAALASQPGAEAIVLVACFALVILAALVRRGALVAINAALLRGGLLDAAIRYVVLLAVGSLALGAILPADATDGFARFAYRLVVAATLLIAASLIAPTRVGALVQAQWRRLRRRAGELADARVFARIASIAGAFAATAFVAASLLPAFYAEPFAMVAYAAVVVAAVSVALECRLKGKDCSAARG
ncbi:MAG: hypothetical protein JO104_06740 [Candidatus Eremiobacteraeota bacterium]|nr:hypothetical protein [Candidatus Eremiobacteraeota bacterium]